MIVVDSAIKKRKKSNVDWPESKVDFIRSSLFGVQFLKLKIP